VVFGATGHVGSKVVKLLAKRTDVAVKAFVRPTSNKKPLTDQGVAILEGNLLDKSSVEKALNPSSHAGQTVDVVIYSAATYMGRQSGDTQDQDMAAFTNVADAAKAGKVKRVIITSIVAAELATNVPHFYDKFRQEQYLKQQGIPFISVRAPAFVDQTAANDFIAQNVKKNFIPTLADPNAKTNFVHTDHLAFCIVKSVDLPSEANNKILYASNKELVSWNDLAAEFGRQLGGRKFTSGPPIPGIGLILGVGALFNNFAHDMNEMFKFMNTGQYIVTDWGETEKYFGKPPTLADTVSSYLATLKERVVDTKEEPGFFSRIFS